MKATLSIQRGALGEAPHQDTFDIPFEHGQSILDGLRAIRRSV